MPFVNRSWCCEQLRLNFEARDRAGLYILATSKIHGIDADPSFLDLHAQCRIGRIRKVQFTDQSDPRYTGAYHTLSLVRC